MNELEIENLVLEVENEAAAYKEFDPVFRALLNEHVTAECFKIAKHMQKGEWYRTYRGGSALVRDWNALHSARIKVIDVVKGLHSISEASNKEVFGRVLENWLICNAPHMDVDIYLQQESSEARSRAYKAIENAKNALAEKPHHLDKVIAEQDQYFGRNRCSEINQPITTNKEPAVMIKIETRTFLNNTYAASFKDEELFAKIAEAENEVERLEAIKTKPKKLQAKIDELKAGIEALSAYIDAR